MRMMDPLGIVTHHVVAGMGKHVLKPVLSPQRHAQMRRVEMRRIMMAAVAGVTAGTASTQSLGRLPWKCTWITWAHHVWEGV
jgi:hypothetical protein